MKFDIKRFSNSLTGRIVTCIGSIIVLGITVSTFAPAIASGDLRGIIYMALLAFILLPLPVVLLLQFVSERGLAFPTTPLWVGLNYLGLLGRPFGIRYLELIGIFGRVEDARNQMQYEKAESMALEAIASVPAASRDQTALSMIPSLAMMTAILQCKMGKFEEALALTERYVAPAWESYKLSKSPEAARHLGFNMNTLGCVFDDLNRPTEALNCYTTAIELKRRAGSEKVTTEEANVGYANLCSGNLVVAEQSLQSILATLDAGPLANSKLCSSVRANLGETLIELDKWEEAAPLIWSALHRKRELLHKNNPDRARVIVSAARLLEHENKQHEAQECFEEALAICANSVGEVHAETLHVLKHYGEFLQRSSAPEALEIQKRYESVLKQLSEIKIPETVEKLAATDVIETESAIVNDTTDSATHLNATPPNAQGDHPAVLALMKSRAKQSNLLYYGLLAFFLFRNGINTFSTLLVLGLAVSAGYRAISTRAQIKKLSKLIYSQESVPAKVNLVTSKFLGIFPAYKGSIVNSASGDFRNEKLTFVMPVANTRPLFSNNTVQTELILDQAKRKILLLSTPLGLVQTNEGKWPAGVASLVGVIVILTAGPAILIGAHLLGGAPPEKVPVGLTAEKYYDLGVDYKGVGWTEQSRESLKLAMSLDPKGVGKRANIFLRTKLPHIPVSQDAVQMNITGFNNQFVDKQKAESSWKECITKYPDFEWPYSNLASLYIEENRLKEAEPLLEKAIKLNPDYINALNNLANLKRKQNEFSAAREMLQRVITLDPDNLEAKLLMKSMPQ